MITKEQLQFLRKEFGELLTVINPKTKKPKAVFQGNYDSNKKPKYEWFYNWTDEELLKAESVGIYHQKKIDDFNKETVFGAVDPDDKSYIAHNYMTLIPNTMTVIKQIGKDNNFLQTQRIYKVNGQGFPKFDYGGDSKDDGKLIETLQSGVSVITSKEKTFTANTPVEVDPEYLSKCLKLACFFTEVEKKFPKVAGGRDVIHLRLAGALARLDENDYPTTLLEQFHGLFCNNIGDDEVSNRVNKISYQRKQLQNGKEVYGIKELANILEANFKSYDLLKSNVEVVEEESKPYPLITFNKMLEINYPVPKFILDPIIREKTVTQISGDYGSGKTHVGLKLALDLSQGFSFHVEETHRFKKDVADNGGYDWYRHNGKTIPTLYVEGELPAVDVRDRTNTLVQPFIESGTPAIDLDKMHFLTLDDLEMNGFKFGFEPLAVTNDEETAKRNRRKIENLMNRIKDKTGQYPVLFLDNITALTSIDENKSTDWSGLMMWIMLLKTKGVIVVFFHHTGKTTGTASGSNLAQRLVDTHIILKKLQPKACFPDFDGVQCSVHFDKFRNFGGKRTNPFMLICDKQGKWTKYNMLMDQRDFKILELHKEGKSVDDMCKIEPELKKPTVYRRIDQMKKAGIIIEEKFKL